MPVKLGRPRLTMQIQKILFPIDFSESIGKVIPWAINFAKQFNATLCLVSITPDMSSFASFYAPHTNIKGFQQEVLQGAETKMKELVGTRFKDVAKLESRVLIGKPAEMIIELAHKEKADMIIMGTHGRTGLEKTIFGSVAEKVVKSAPCPVLTIRPGSV